MDFHMLTESRFPTDEDVSALLTAFHDGTLARSAWNHRAHMTAALSFGRALPTGAALDAMRAGILKLNDAAGIVSTPDSGYHETITRFYMHVIALHVSANPTPESLAADANALMDVWGRADLPLDFWSRERLFSREARARWVPPDRQPLPATP
jgi:hypothetical protein